MPIDLSGDATMKVLIWGLVMFVSIPFAGYYGVAYWDNGIAGAVAGFVIGSVLALLGLFVVSQASSIFGVLAGERSASFSRREQLESDMQQARYHKANKEYDVALRKVNELLKSDPEYPEALFLKAQIVWEGFNNRASAEANLKKVQEIVTDETAAIYLWASSLLDEISAHGHQNEI